jgi:hypothetical protein
MVDNEVIYKKCPRCISKPLAEFSFKNKEKIKYQSWCKECQGKATKQHYRNNPGPYKERSINAKKSTRQSFLIWLSTKSCVDCGESDPDVLDCDHVSGTKKYSIAKMIGCGTWEHLQTELAKCVIRCANCHRRKTAKERGFTRKPNLN